MTNYRKIEIIVGIFVFVGLLGMAWLSIRLGEVGGFGSSGYMLTAKFSDAGGMRPGGDVMIAGVVVGEVTSVALDGEEEAKLTLRLNDGIKVTKDAIAAIRTKGIIGDRYVRISQGADEEFIKPGSEIVETEAAMNLEDLVGKYIFDSKPKSEDGSE